ncbi:MAG: M14 family zinc carboxypeptidase [candidate division WOR-3 bacterium]
MIGILIASSLVRIYAPLKEVERLPIKDLDIAGFSARGEWTDIHVKDLGELKFLKEAGFRYEVIIPDVDSYISTVAWAYHNTNDVYNLLVNYKNSYPSITKLDTLGFSWEGRPIVAIRITDNPNTNEGEPGVLVMGTHHAREWPALEIPLFFIDTLLRGYGSDPFITNAINNLDIWIIPLVNPDGHNYSRTVYSMWRKNRRYFPSFGTYGVDLNRNYGGSADGNPGGEWCTPTPGTSNYPNSDTYCGPEIFSEPEIKAVLNLLDSVDIVASISYHTYTGAVLYPWGYTTNPTPDNTYLSNIASDMASQMVTENNNPYVAIQAPQIGYTATADSDDWIYGYSLFVKGYPTLAFTVEACESFQPSASLLDQIVRENYKGFKVILQNAPNIRSNMIPYPIISQILVPDTVSSPFNINISLKNPISSPTKYALKYYTGYSYSTDGAEGGLGLWNYNGFTTSSTRAHSGTYSFRANYGNNVAYHMTTKYPYYVKPGDSLTFWTWYDIEENYDAAFVEISEDGRYFYPLEKITGTSTGWVRKSYSLHPWVGKWIYIRFRFATDGSVTANGFYVDDINPVPSFSSQVVVDTNITSLPYTLSLPNGEYYFSARGYNSAKGWGDWSMPKKVVVVPATYISEKDSKGPESGIIYDITGRKVEKTTKGVYFIVKGGRVEKIIKR